MNLGTMMAEANKPKESGNFITKPGAYLGYIDKYTIKTSKAGNDYLSLVVKLSDMDGKKCGNIFPMIFDSDKPFLQRQAGRFLRALDFIPEGEMTLEEIGQLAEKRSIYVVTRIDEGKDGYKDKAVVDFNDADGYYMEDEWDMIDTMFNKHEVWDPDGTANDFMNVPEGTDETHEFW